MAQTARPAPGPPGPPPGWSRATLAGAPGLLALGSNPPSASAIRHNDGVAVPRDGIGWLSQPVDPGRFPAGAAGALERRPAALPPNSFPRLW